MALEDESLVLSKGASSATLKIEDGALVIDLSGVSCLSIRHGEERIRVEADRVRLDGGERIEIHADNVLRVDAGGSGITYMPLHWHYFYPEYGHSSFVSPPEHPDGISGRVDWSGSSAFDDNVDDYYARFPNQASGERPK